MSCLMVKIKIRSYLFFIFDKFTTPNKYDFWFKKEYTKSKIEYTSKIINSLKLSAVVKRKTIKT